MLKKRGKGERGVVLLATFMILVTLTAIAVVFLYMNSAQTVSAGWGIPDAQALWLADAGKEKAIWYLKTPVSGGGQGENWTTTGTTENLGAGSYAMVVTRYDFCLAANGSSASASSAGVGREASKAIDGDDSTYWESTGQPSAGDPEEIILRFPYPLTVNKVRFLVPSGTEHTPKNYTWEVSSDGVNYTAVVTVNNNSARDVTDTFTASSNVNYLKFHVTSVGIIVPAGGPPGVPRVRIATLEALGSKITSSGTAGTVTRTVTQTVVADDGSPENQKAYNEIDWNEI